VTWTVPAVLLSGHPEGELTRPEAAGTFDGIVDEPD
jgi:hypothetical protein